MNSLIVRGATGIVFVGLLLAAILYGYIPFGILFGIVTGLAVNEFCNIAGEYKKTTFSTLSAVLGGMYLFFVLFAVKSLSFMSLACMMSSMACSCVVSSTSLILMARPVRLEKFSVNGT